MTLSELTSKPFLLLDDPHNPYVTEEIIWEWGIEDNVLMPVFEICKYGYILGTLKPNVKCCFCSANNPYRLKGKDKSFKCRNCRKKFNVFTDTIFNNKKYPFMYYGYICDRDNTWDDIVNGDFVCNATFYRVREKFAFMNDLEFDNIFLKWQYLLNYKP